MIPARPPAKYNPTQDALDSMPKAATTAAGQLLQELNQKTQRPEDPEPAMRTPGGRGSRPGRPSQISRETGRSWERMTEKVVDLTLQLSNAKHDLTTCQEKLQVQTEENKRLAGQVSQLQEWNASWQAAHQQLVTSMPSASEWKVAYEREAAEKIQLQKQVDANAQERATLVKEMKDASESRRNSLQRDHIHALKAKDRMMTELREEILQKEQLITALQKAQTKAQKAQSDRERERERHRKRTRGLRLRESESLKLDEKAGRGRQRGRHQQKEIEKIKNERQAPKAVPKDTPSNKRKAPAPKAGKDFQPRLIA